MEQIASYKKGKKFGKTLNKNPKLVGGAILGLIASSYIMGVIYYSSHFLYKSTLNGIDVSGKTVKSVAKIISDYELKVKEATIDGKKVKETMAGSEFDMQLQDEEAISELIKKQNKYLWFLPSKNHYTVDDFIKIDEHKLESAILKLQGFDKDFYKEPIDAKVTEYDPENGYQIIKEEEGNKLDQAKTFQAIQNAILSLESDIDLLESDCYERPSVRSEDADLKEQCDLLNKYVNVTITYKFGENEEVLDGNTISQWVSIENNEVNLSYKDVEDYVASLRKKYDTIFRKREFMTSYGKNITIDGGDYGWWMNYGAETKALYEMIKQGESGERTPIYFQTAVSYGKKDYGDTYVEINLTAQHLFFYKDGKKILESDFVSGNTSTGHGTPAGVYGITYKERDAVLVGENYQTPVAYWMPFNQDIGLHDAFWKSEFGSNFYQTDGSHGCINLPYSVAKQLYEYVEKGTPVICYELADTESQNITEQSPQEIAQFAIDAINRIGTVTKSSGKKIERARKVYNKINSEAKKCVTNYNVLEAAEQKFRSL